MREARYDSDGLDEYVADDVTHFHLEQMSNVGWCLILDHADGEQTIINVFSASGRARVDANVQ